MTFCIYSRKALYFYIIYYIMLRDKDFKEKLLKEIYQKDTQIHKLKLELLHLEKQLDILKSLTRENHQEFSSASCQTDFSSVLTEKIYLKLEYAIQSINDNYYLIRKEMMAPQRQIKAQGLSQYLVECFGQSYGKTLITLVNNMTDCEKMLLRDPSSGVARCLQQVSRLESD